MVGFLPLSCFDGLYFLFNECVYFEEVKKWLKLKVVYNIKGLEEESQENPL